MKTSLTAEATARISSRLKGANESTARDYPGESGRRQPVHTVYGGAHLFRADTAQRLGALALRTLEQFAPDAATLARAVGLTGEDATQNFSSQLAETVYTRSVEKLRREPVEEVFQ